MHKRYFEICLEVDDSLNLEKLQPYPNATKIRVIRLWLVLFDKEDETLAEKAQLLLDKTQEENSFKLQICNDTYIQKLNDLLTLEKQKKYRSIPYCAVPLLGKLFFSGQFSCSARSLKYSSILHQKILNKEVNPQFEAYIASEQTLQGIFVRSRKQGDLFQPLGTPGKKKLSDRMIDRKWTEINKTETPIFLNHKEEILWVPGFPPSELNKVSATNEWVIHLTYQPLPTECFRG